MTIVLGAGVTGLAAAVLLKARGEDVVVLEAADRAGGAVRTELREGYVLEHGPESIRGGAPAVRRVLERVGLVERVITASRAASARYLLHRGALVRVPSSPLGFLRSPLLRRRAALRMLAEPLVPGGATDGESVRAFVRRRIGRGATEALLDAVIGGITAGDPRQLDARTLLPRPWGWERDHGGLFRGMLASRDETVEPKRSFTFPRGMGELVEALVDAVGPSLRLGEPAERVESGPGGLVVHGRRERFPADRLIVTCAPEIAGRLLDDLHVPRLPRAPVAAVHLAYPAEAVPGGLPGFGWLASSRERRDVLGCLWVSGTFPSHAPAGRHLLRIMLGGAREPALAEAPDERLIDHARAVLRDVQGVNADPVLAHVVRALPGIPQYPPGWGAFVDGLARWRPAGITFAGWYYGGVGVADGLAAADRITSA